MNTEELSAERIAHLELQKAAEKIYQDHGIIIENASFDWAIVLGGKSQVISTNLQTKAWREMPKSDSETTEHHPV